MRYLFSRARTVWVGVLLGACPLVPTQALISSNISQNFVDEQEPSFMVSFIRFFLDDEAAERDLEKIWVRNAARLSSVDPDTSIYNITYPEGFERLSEKEQAKKAFALFEERKYAVVKQAYYDMMFSRAFWFLFSAIVFINLSEGFVKIAWSYVYFHILPESLRTKVPSRFQLVEASTKATFSLGAFGSLWRFIARWITGTGELDRAGCLTHKGFIIQDKDTRAQAIIDRVAQKDLKAFVELIGRGVEWGTGSQTLGNLVRNGWGGMALFTWVAWDYIKLMFRQVRYFMVLLLAYFGKLRYHDKLESLELRYMAMRHFMAEDLRGTVERVFHFIRSNPEHITQGTEIIEQCLALPARIKPVTYDQARIDELFGDYDPIIKAYAEQLIFRIVLWSEARRNGTDDVAEVIERFPIMLIGVPGVGKTEFVKRIAKVLDLPLSELRLEGGLGALFGVPDQTPSKVALSLIAAAGPEGRDNYENGILLIDEAGRMLHDMATENFFLKFVDPTNSTHPDLFFHAKVRLPMFIFCTDNFPIKDAAIADRFIQIKFPPVEHKNKFNIARNVFVPKKLSQYRSLPYAISLDDLTEEDYDAMEAMIKTQEKQEDAEDSGSLRPAQRAVNIFLEKKLRERYLVMMDEGEEGDPADEEAHEEDDLEEEELGGDMPAVA